MFGISLLGSSTKLLSSPTRAITSIPNKGLYVRNREAETSWQNIMLLYE